MMIEFPFLVPNLGFGQGTETIVYGSFNSSRICEGDSSMENMDSFCFADYETNSFPTFSPTSYLDIERRKLESVYQPSSSPSTKPSSRPTFHPTLARGNTLEPTLEPTFESTPEAEYNILHSLGCIISIEDSGGYVNSMLTRRPTRLPAPSPPPTRQVNPILQLKFGFTIAPTWESAAESSNLPTSATYMVCNILDIDPSNCICGLNCLKIIAKDTSIILQQIEYELKVEVDVSVNTINFPEYMSNHTALVQHLGRRYIAAISDRTNYHLRLFLLEAVLPFFDYFFGSNTFVESPTFSLSMVQLPPTWSPTTSPSQLPKTGERSFPVEGVIGIVVGVVGLLVILFCIGGFFIFHNLNNLPSQLQMTRTVGKVLPEP